MNNNDTAVQTSAKTMAKTTIFYYTGTGNSLWVARLLARELGNTDLVSMINFDKKQPGIDAANIGLVFPVHIWGVPRRVLEFLEYLPAMSPEYLFAVAVNAGSVSNTLVQLQKAVDQQGLTLASGWSVVLPSNYIPWGGPGPINKQKERFTGARIKIADIASKVAFRIEMPMEKGPLWKRIVLTWIYNLSFPHVPELDKNFWVDERCNQCGLCVKLCPSGNILMIDEKLTWSNHCEQCLACIQWCPQEALQYGKKTPAYARYHHPEIKARDLLDR